MTVKELNQDERILFAGALRRLVQAEGWVTDAEIAGIEELRTTFGFSDLDDALDEFAARVKRGNDFDAQALAITDPDSRAFILDRLIEVSLMDGYRDRSEEAFIEHLKALWA